MSVLLELLPKMEEERTHPNSWDPATRSWAHPRTERRVSEGHSYTHVHGSIAHTVDG